MSDLAASLLAFTVVLVLLIIYSAFDIQKRKVPNQVILVGLIIGILTNIISRHFYKNPLLHLFAFAFTLPISYILFRLGAFGGADAKALILVAIISPGFEFLIWLNPLIEAILATSIEVVIMLFLGFLSWHYSKKHDKETLFPPLILFLLIGYILVASFATFAVTF
jgi:preflagellin peptidase FlaK